MKQNLNTTATFKGAETAMWRLVQRYTRRVGYKRIVKAKGLAAEPPVIASPVLPVGGTRAPHVCQAFRVRPALGGTRSKVRAGARGRAMSA